MSQDSIVGKRFFDWHNACLAFGFNIAPPLSASSLSSLAPGEVGFRATRQATVDGKPTTITLDVSELWLPGDDPTDAWKKLNAEGCHVSFLSWHAQVGMSSGARGAERLDVGEGFDEHPRIHRPPYGEENEVRLSAELAVPSGWLGQLNELLAGALDDGLQSWEELADEEDQSDEADMS